MECSDWINLTGVVISAIAIIVSMIVTNCNTNKQIRNQNKESYRPRLRLKEFEDAYGFDVARYMITSMKYDKNETKNNKSNYTKLILENIGYGIANNVTFYDLVHGEKCLRTRLIKNNQNQVSMSTNEIPKDKEESYEFIISFNEKMVKDVDNTNGDFVLLICNYQDLNNNNYKILIGYSMKNINENEDGYSCNYDYYYYQEGTKAYNAMIKKYKNEYKKIKSQIAKFEKISD